MGSVAHPRSAGAATLLMAMLGSLLAYRSQHGSGTPTAPPVQAPRVQPEDGYTSSRACQRCHASHYRSWHRSYHRAMTQAASPASVFGDFSGVELSRAGQRLRLQRRGERFTASVRDANPQLPAFGPSVLAPGEYTIGLVTGSHHMQIYWYGSDQGGLTPLPFAYLKQAKRWVPREMVFLRPPASVALPETERWNTSCIHCHTTRGQPWPSPAGGFDSQVAELGIACEACHGPGADHVAAFTSPLPRYQRYLDGSQPTHIINPARLTPERSSQICSRCHALWQFDRAGHTDWSRSGWRYEPGDDPEATMWLLSPGRADSDVRVRTVMRQAKAYVDGQYWSDGQARVSGREYNGMIDSACATRGELACASCHRMHQASSDPRPASRWADDQLDVGMAGDRACVQCHRAIGGALTAHTRHQEHSAGSRCYNCHMPHTSYGLLKAMRAHKVTVPSADETVDTGRPNACNLCHLDRTLSWAADRLQADYGSAQRRPIAEVDHQVALAARLALQGDAGQRALIAWALGWSAAFPAYEEAFAPALLGVLMDDPYAAVRYIAHDALQNHQGFADLSYDYTQPPQLRDPAARRVAARLHPKSDRLPAAVPISARGELTALGKQLLSRRDDHPVQLLE